MGRVYMEVAPPQLPAFAIHATAAACLCHPSCVENYCFIGLTSACRTALLRSASHKRRSFASINDCTARDATRYMYVYITVARTHSFLCLGRQRRAARRPACLPNVPPANARYRPCSLHGHIHIRAVHIARRVTVRRAPKQEAASSRLKPSRKNRGGGSAVRGVYCAERRPRKRCSLRA
jgi:hypothetical protein